MVKEAVSASSVVFSVPRDVTIASASAAGTAPPNEEILAATAAISALTLELSAVTADCRSERALKILSNLSTISGAETVTCIPVMTVFTFQYGSPFTD